MSETPEKKEVLIQAYTQHQLIQLYGVSRKTFMSWLKPFQKKIGVLRGKCYTPQQVRIIFESIDPPQ